MTTPEVNHDYVKHMLECNCVLPQFANRQPPVFHRFVVFSELHNGVVKPSYAECNNCGAIHKVEEVFESKILPKETWAGVPKIEEVKRSIPPVIMGAIDGYSVGLTTLQEIAYICRYELWGKPVILVKEDDGTGVVYGKYIILMGENLYKINEFTNDDDE